LSSTIKIYDSEKIVRKERKINKKIKKLNIILVPKLIVFKIINQINPYKFKYLNQI